MEAQHYSRSYPVARCRVGLMVKPSRFSQDYLAGVAVYSVPMQPATITKYLQVAPAQGVELGRLVLLDDDGSGAVGFNAESWFLARAMRLLRQAHPGLAGVVSYADPVPRFAPTGEMVKPGHSGICYRASNSVFHGRSRGRTLIVNSRGEVANERMLSKIRLEENGIDYACRRLHEMGAPERQQHESGPVYLRRALAEGGFSTMKHPGNFVFTWSWGRR
uniref:Mom family adenine methylcarbamoylation protein n=1 Tax=Geomonas subterranea TaxID=2847989 RepID=UPI001CD21C97|nr:hypothetical protein [Geomonas fuzhouensis]